MSRKVDRVQVIERSVLARVVIIAMKEASVTIGYFLMFRRLFELSRERSAKRSLTIGRFESCQLYCSMIQET